MKPVIVSNIESEYGLSTDFVMSKKHNDVKLINALYKFNMVIPDNWIEILLENKTEYVQKFLANLTSHNETNQKDLININLKLLNLFWVEKKLDIDKTTLEDLVKSFTFFNTEFDYASSEQLNENVNIASNEDVSETPFFILTAPKNRRYTYRGYESIPLIKNEIILQKDKLNTVICNL